ncbi:TVP38/TMEM64 family protein [Candidatus Babeliales bacterium]|nr:TVP38/TMEM64 family protein [Candidatus Babeliales bacterium]
MNTKYRNRIIILVLLISAFGLLHYFGFTSYLSTTYLKEFAENAREFASDNYMSSVLSFIGLLTLLLAFSIPAGILVPIIGGFLFGWIPGAFYSVIGATLGATCSFLMARYFIGDYIHERYTKRLEKFNTELNNYGYLYLIGLHFFPVTPFFILNILAGATNISAKTFMWTTLVGVTPAYLIYSYIGQQLISIENFTAMVSTKIIAAFIVLKILSLTTLLLGRFGIRRHS